MLQGIEKITLHPTENPKTFEESQRQHLILTLYFY